MKIGDPTALYFKYLSDKTLIFKINICYGGKINRKRVTSLLGVNIIDLEKLKPLAIAKLQKPRYFAKLCIFMQSTYKIVV